MRIIYAPMLIALAALVAGCSSPPEPGPEPTQTLAAPTSSPTAPPDEPLLATPDDARDAVQTGPGDDRKPTTSFYAALNAGEPQFFEDGTPPVAGTVSLRVSCTAETGQSVTVDFTPTGGATSTTEAPCGNATATSTSLVTSQGEPFELSTTWKILVTSENRAVVAVGIVRD